MKKAKKEMEKQKKKVKQPKEKVKRSKKKVKQNEISQKESRKRKLRTALLMGFAAPVIFIFSLGFISYNLASDAMIKNYESSSNDILEANARYMESIFEEVATQSIKIITNKNFDYYYNGKSDDMFENLEYMRNLKNDVMTNSVLIDGIRSMYILSNNRAPIVTGNDQIQNSPYELFTSTDLIAGESKKDGWYGSHSAIDAKEKKGYGLSYIKEALKGKAYVITDIDHGYVESMLDNMYQEGAITSIVTKDGVEVYSTESKVGEDNIFANQDYYIKVLESGKTSGHEYVTLNDVNYLFTYSKVGETELVLCNLIPKTIILKNATSIGKASIAFAIVSAIIALMIGTALARGIGKAIGDMKDTMESVAQGDLTVQFKTKRKDEFKILENSLSNMIGNMQHLVKEVAEVSDRVNVSAEDLSNTSSIVLESSKNISIAINEVAIGSSKQVIDTDSCLKQMSTLSDMVNKVYDETNEIDGLFENTMETVASGLTIVNNLNDKAKATSQITKEISIGMKNLEENSRSIENIVNAINEISEQTNLLSLNASIEAARAGDSGRGFAVVAGEIRNLATKSMESANQIQEIINSIQYQTNATAKTTQKAEQIVLTQEKALQDTIQVFGSINKLVEDLVLELDKIKQYVAGMESARNDTLDSIQNISAVSEESAAASEEVSATAISQSEEIEQLAGAAEGLTNDAKVLQQAIGKFKI
ncbi:methyl-accepting chemotaxis sensory transducer with Cache sensor [Anaerosporobacter mobilis DSM 15930]|jgi:methyl-accepting chemotaxis protein|uniref:Methyl-accepting chemotaxis sensory transducer with Cache sensor n=1 Tax=Anaerosporobacter mobilis DSM 15930 TaxID=1120996 RepID=A0A1M7JXJ3_9FIRM|nr:methyl-accepting chemotaxis protein [Anaerosporobacter mobilis]SHM57443.1 methyl-accepting chemotaxis sensory transducer with Cache sensor [Anaerosporobacter mobilis DSM 15930]